MYFKKMDSPNSSSWKIGQVEQVIASQDGLIRRVVIKYFNSQGESPEDVSQPEFTDRSVRTKVKLWSIDEVSLNDDLVELHQKYDTRGNHEEGVTDDHGGVNESELNEAGVATGIL